MLKHYPGQFIPFNCIVILFLIITSPLHLDLTGRWEPDYLTHNPLDGIRTAVTRLPLPANSTYTIPYRPEERISLKQAIESATYTGPYADFRENSTGTLEPGKLADIIVIDKDLFTLPQEDINKAHVVATYLQGKQVFEGPQAFTT